MKVVLIVGAFAGRSLSDVVHEAMRLADAARREEKIICAPCLDRRISCIWTDVAEVHSLEKAAIARKFPDEVQFTDLAAPDVAELAELAREMGYGE